MDATDRRILEILSENANAKSTEIGQGDKIVAFRADMDALPVTEKTNLSYASKNVGKMHACGHDAHTAVMRAAAKYLKQQEEKLPCRIRLVFQPSEEGAVARRFDRIAGVAGMAVVSIPSRMSSEDFAWYLEKSPGMIFRFGTRNEEKGCVQMAHWNDFCLGEDGMKAAIQAFIAYGMQAGSQENCK